MAPRKSGPVETKTRVLKLLTDGPLGLAELYYRVTASQRGLLHAALDEMEASGVVRKELVVTGRQGRPKTVYETTEVKRATRANRRKGSLSPP